MKRKHKYIIVTLVGLFLLTLSFFLGYKFAMNSYTLNYPVQLVPKKGKKITTRQLTFFKDQIMAQKKSFDFSKIKAIRFLKEKKKITNKLNKWQKKLLGKFKLKVGNYRGSLVFFQNRSGYLSAFIQFTNWGSGKREYLRSIKVNKTKISFIRSCKGKSCQKIKTTPFTQKFIGERKASLIKGKYLGSRTSGSWSAIR